MQKKSVYIIDIDFRLFLFFVEITACAQLQHRDYGVRFSS